jgi:uncharacterized membrane protein HdeD (DUF308 family)
MRNDHRIYQALTCLMLERRECMLKIDWPGGLLAGLMYAVIGIILIIAMQYGGLVLFALIAVGLIVGIVFLIISGYAAPYENLLRDVLNSSAAIAVAILGYQRHMSLWMILVIAVAVWLLLYGLLHVDYGRFFHKHRRRRNSS